MAIVISLQGIDQVISGLGYRNQSALKYKVIHAIRSYYHDQSQIESLKGIPMEDLIAMLWGLEEDPAIIRNKKKNLSTLRCAVNADLKKLYDDGANPEGISIGSENTFVMSDEAKEKLLLSFATEFGTRGEHQRAVSLEQIEEVLGIVSDILKDPAALAGKEGSDGSNKLEHLKEIIKGISDKLGLRGEDQQGKGENAGQGPGGQMPAGDAGNGGRGAAGYMELQAALPADGREEGGATPAQGGTEGPQGPEQGGEELGDSKQPDDAGPAGEDKSLEEPAFEDDEVVEDLVDADVDEADEATVDDADVEDALEDADVDEADATVEDADVEAGQGGALEDVEDAEGLEEADADGAGAAIEDANGAQGLEDADVEDALDDAGDAEVLEDAEVVNDLGPAADEPEGAEGLQEGLEDDAGPAGEDESLEEPASEDDEVVEEEAVADENELSEEVLEDDAGPAEELAVDEEADAGQEAIADEDDVVEELVDADVDEADAEALEDADVDEADATVEGADVEAGQGGALEDVEDAEGLEEADADGAGAAIEDEALEQAGENDLPAAEGAIEDLAQYYLDDRDQEKGSIEKGRVLAEEFNSFLSARDKSYNVHIEIPAGVYIVGSSAPGKDDRPEHRVKLSRFYIGKFPVTNTLFQVFIEKTGYKTTAERHGFSTVYTGRLQDTADEYTGLITSTCKLAVGCQIIHGACWYQPTGPGSNINEKRNHPVVHVSIEDAMAFAAWTGKRVPTEDEWEAAARGEEGRAFPWGDEWKDGACNIEESAFGDTTPVEQYIKFSNDLGISDMTGNVLEWTLDMCDPPAHVNNSATYRIVKGGSWISGKDVRLYSRFRWNSESPSNILGFRCIAF